MLQTRIKCFIPFSYEIYIYYNSLYKWGPIKHTDLLLGETAQMRNWADERLRLPTQPGTYTALCCKNHCLTYSLEAIESVIKRETNTFPWKKIAVYLFHTIYQSLKKMLLKDQRKSDYIYFDKYLYLVFYSLDSNGIWTQKMSIQWLKK